MAEALPNPFLHHLRHLIGSVPAAAMIDGGEASLTKQDGFLSENSIHSLSRLPIGG
jgi:hypothetical protein